VPALELYEPVVLRLTTVDVVMRFRVSDRGARETIIPGPTNDVASTPTRVRDFTLLDDVFSGTGHENMDGTPHVVA